MSCSSGTSTSPHVVPTFHGARRCPITPLRLVDQDGVGGTAPSAAVSVAVDDLHKAIGSAENRIALAGMLPSERTHFGRLHKLVLEIIEGGAAPASQGGREDRGDDALGEGEEDEEEEGPSGDVPPAGSQQEQSGEESAAARAGAALRSLAHLIGISNSQRDCVAWFGSSSTTTVRWWTPLLPSVPSTARASPAEPIQKPTLHQLRQAHRLHTHRSSALPARSRGPAAGRG